MLDFCKQKSWGIGHSTGLLLVGSIFIIKDYVQSRNGDSTDEQDPVDIPDSVGHFFESLVGIFMLGLGVFGFRSALMKRRGLEEEHTFVPSIEAFSLHTHVDNKPLVEQQNSPTDQSSIPETPSYRDELSMESNGIATTNVEPFQDEVNGEEGCVIPSQNTLEVDSQVRYQDSESDQHGHDSIRQWSRRLSSKTLALCAGIVHGLAGPGGVLGVIPAVQLHSWKLAVCYLGSFCISSTLTMGVFASTYAALSTSLGRRTHLEFQIQMFSASLSIAVGIIWLVLLSCGKLEDVFP